MDDARRGSSHSFWDPSRYDSLIGVIVPEQPFLLSCITSSLPRQCNAILELGCGTGLLTGKLREECPDAGIWAIDKSQEMLGVAARRENLSGVTFLARDLRDPWPKGPYSAIVTSLCLHHVSPAERYSVAARAAKALVPGGRFICGDIFRAETDWEERLSMESWARLMSRGGAPDNVVQGMLQQRAGRRAELSTIGDFRRSLEMAGFARSWVPFQSWFVGLVVGEVSGPALGGGPPYTPSPPVPREGWELCRP